MCSPTCNPTSSSIAMIDSSNNNHKSTEVNSSSRRIRPRRAVSFDSASPTIHLVERIEQDSYRRSDFLRFRRDFLQEQKQQKQQEEQKDEQQPKPSGPGAPRRRRRRAAAPQRRGNLSRSLPGKERRRNQTESMASMQTMRDHARATAATETKTSTTATVSKAVIRRAIAA